MSIAKSGSDSITVHWRIEQWHPELGAEALAKLKVYHDELLKFNKTINLIGVKTIPFADAIHFSDCIIACKKIMSSAKVTEIYDFGSGNGFPGLIIALLYPSTKVQLIDADQRKAEFLKHMITTLGLKNASVSVKMVEAIPEGSVEFAVSRGFAPISKAILLTRKIFKKGGIYFHMKGEEWATEVSSIPTQLCSFWSPSLLSDYKLPVGEIKFAVVKTEKIG